MIIQVRAEALQDRNQRFRDKRRSGRGFWHNRRAGGGGKKGCSGPCGRMLASNLMSVCSSVCPFRGCPKGPLRCLRGPRRGRTRTRGGVRRRRVAQAAPRSAVLGKCAEGRERRSGPPGRSGFLSVHKSDVENPRCRSRSPVRCTGRREARRSRQSTKAWACSTPAVHSALLLMCHCTRRGRNPRKIGGHAPVVELRVR